MAGRFYKGRANALIYKESHTKTDEQRTVLSFAAQRLHPS